MMAIVQQLTGAIDLDLTAAFSFRCKCPNHNMTDQVGASGGEWHQDTACKRRTLPAPCPCRPLVLPSAED